MHGNDQYRGGHSIANVYQRGQSSTLEDRLVFVSIVYVSEILVIGYKPKFAE